MSTYKHITFITSIPYPANKYGDMDREVEVDATVYYDTNDIANIDIDAVYDVSLNIDLMNLHVPTEALDQLVEEARLVFEKNWEVHLDDLEASKADKAE